MALTAEDQHDHERAIDLARQALAADANSGEAFYLLALLYVNVDQYEAARTMWETLHSKNPDDLESSMMLTACYAQLEEHAHKALDLLQTLPEAARDTTGMILMQGIAFAKQKQYSLAIEAFKRAPLTRRNMDSTLLAIHLNLGQAYEQSGDLKRALKEYERVYVNDPSYVDVVDRIARLQQSG